MYSAVSHKSQNVLVYIIILLFVTVLKMCDSCCTLNCTTFSFDFMLVGVPWIFLQLIVSVKLVQHHPGILRSQYIGHISGLRYQWILFVKRVDFNLIIGLLYWCHSLVKTVGSLKACIHYMLIKA